MPHQPVWTPPAAGGSGTVRNNPGLQTTWRWTQPNSDFVLWRKDQESSRSLQLEHKESKEGPLRWPDHNNIPKPSRVDANAQQAVVNRRTGGTRTNSKSLSSRTADASTVPQSCNGGTTAQALQQLCENGQLGQAVDVLTVLAETKSRVPSSLLYRVIQRCGAEKNLVLARRLDNLIVKLGHESDAFWSNHVLRMYASQGRLEEATKVFTRVPKPNAFMWLSIISEHVKQGKAEHAIRLYHEILSSGQEPNDRILAAAIQACARAKDVESGRQAHAHVLQWGLQNDSVVCNCLVDMYAKCGHLEDARRVFDSLAKRDVVTWNAMINGYAEHGLGHQALILHATMEQEGLVVANRVTYVCLLKACASAGALQQGRQLHSQVVERGLLDGDMVMVTRLIDMYAKCGQMEDALAVFDSLGTRNVVVWTAMINAYVEHGLGQQALTFYDRMEQEGLTPADKVTYVCLLKACASSGAVQKGRQLHSQLVERGLLSGDHDDIVIMGSCLVDMYAKCGQLEEARTVFDSLCTKNVVAWTAMMNGYAEHEQGPQALALYAQMVKQEGLTCAANSVTFACLLKACASAGALQQGRELHSLIVRKGMLDGDISVGNSLVNMYAKCGQLEDARMVFDSLAIKDAVTWNSLINGYGTNNEGRKAVSCFGEMMLAGIQPDTTTFTCLLVACSHEGLVSEGRQVFDAMVSKHDLHPSSEHYVCMVDLLGRAGHLDEAEKMLLSVECNSSAVVGLMSLLHACKSHGDIERGRRCFESILEVEPQHASAYVLMANMYADVDRWADVDRVENLRKLAGASKKAAVAGIEVNQQVQTFAVGEERDGNISGKVRSSSMRLKEEGNHAPHTELVLKPLSEKDKEDQLCGHAEKLALAYGLLNTPDGTPLLVTKNLRMCRDCHSATEIMSRVEKRDIVVRDAHRVHRFQAGFCSCRGRC